MTTHDYIKHELQDIENKIKHTFDQHIQHATINQLEQHITNLQKGIDKTKNHPILDQQQKQRVLETITYCLNSALDTYARRTSQ